MLAVEQFNDIPYYWPPNSRSIMCVTDVIAEYFSPDPKTGKQLEGNQSYNFDVSKYFRSRVVSQLLNFLLKFIQQ